MPSKASKAWSSNTWKVRSVVLFVYLPKSKDCNLPNQIHLEILKHPNRTEWIGYPYIEPLGKNLGIKPAWKKTTRRNTLLLAPSTYLPESFHIAEYLEETYSTPSIFPHGTKSLQHAFQNSFGEKLGFVRYFMLPCVLPKLGTQRSEEYFRRAKELSLGRPLKILEGAEKAEDGQSCERS